MPSVTIYRPPAARKLERDGNLPSLRTGEIMSASPSEKSRVKSPEEVKETNQKSNEMSIFRNAIASIRTQNKVPKCKNVETVKKTETESRLKPEEVTKNGVQVKQRRPDMQVYVPKGRRSVNSEQKTVCESKSCKETQEQKASGHTVAPKVPDKPPEQNSDEKPTQKLPQTEVTAKVDEKKPEKSPAETGCSTKIESGGGSQVKSSASSSSNGSKKSDNSKAGGQLNPEECDWESMYDDSGECLDPSLMEQLTNAVGDVTIEKPKSNYDGYKNKSLDMVADEFPHVIEIYNFPAEFQLQDLMAVFSQFRNSGFEIKWVDDTHALGIFSSSAIVSEVLDFYHPFVKTRALKEGTPSSKMKARCSAEFLKPYKPRPETCSALARRLVTGALGVKLPTFREEREAEKKILTKAREKKRLEAKQRENAWEGTFS